MSLYNLCPAKICGRERRIIKQFQNCSFTPPKEFLQLAYCIEAEFTRNALFMCLCISHIDLRVHPEFVISRYSGWSILNIIMCNFN